MGKLENKKLQYQLSIKYVVPQFNIKKDKLSQLKYFKVNETVN